MQSVDNGLCLDEIPAQLDQLTSLERHIISRRIPFAKLMALPRGKQLAIHGPVVNVPSVPSSLLQLLPRMASDTSIIPLKLKRKLCYRGHYMYGTVDVQRVSLALDWLLSNNSLYADVLVNDNWSSSFITAVDDSSDLELTHPADGQANDSCDSDDTVLYDLDNYNSYDSELDDEYAAAAQDRLRGIAYDTCMHPENEEDIGDKILSLAPAEGQRPLGILADDFFEELAFPDKFPRGYRGYTSTKRSVPLTVRKYFNQRLLNCDGRFARDTDYLFAAQFATESKQILDNITVHVRQVIGRDNKINALAVKDPNRLIINSRTRPSLAITKHITIMQNFAKHYT